MYRLGQKVIITSDSFEQNLPIGEYGYIIAYDRNPDNVYDYVLRVPKQGKHIYITAQDIQSEAVILKQEAERIEKEALIDYALATHDEQLFKRVLNGEADERDSAAREHDDKRDESDFIKQVNLKAWI